MKILVIRRYTEPVIGNIDEAGFLKQMDGHDITWFDSGKSRAYRFKYKIVWDLIRNMQRNKYDLIICSAENSDLLPKQRSRIRTWGRVVYSFIKYPNRFASLLAAWFAPSDRLIALDRSDEMHIHKINYRLMKRCALYFKRELPVNIADAFYLTGRGFNSSRRGASDKLKRDGIVNKLRPISLGVPSMEPFENVELHEKNVDLFFVGTLKGMSLREVRKRGLSILAQLQNRGVKVLHLETPLSYDEYLRQCARSHLVWSPEGLGWDCYRHYEAAAAGSVPVINYPSIMRYAPLRHGRHAFYYGPEEDQLADVVLEALKDKKRLHSMGQAARKHVKRHHTHARLCEYILNEWQNSARPGHKD